jgi:hypothetical protein
MAPVLAVSGGMQKSAALVISLVAVIIGVVAHPVRAQQTPSRQQPVQQEIVPKSGKGEWWEFFRKDANDGNDLSRGLRMGIVHGCMDAFDMSLIVQTRSFDEYRTRRAALMRSDLTMDQILAKVDGYYAEPDNQNHTICRAVLTVLRPQAEG